MSPSSQKVGETLSLAGADVVPAWKQELNERLAATRLRRLRITGEQVSLPGLEDAESKVESRATRLAAKVAQRYANAPSYSEVFAAKARAQAERAAAVTPQTSAEIPIATETSTEICNDVLESELVSGTVGFGAGVDPAVMEPEEEAVMEPLAVNVIEVPRELVAPRKVRPRLAEGPLRETSQTTEAGQLKIFELAPETISQTVKIGTAAADWSPIRLDINGVSRMREDERRASEEVRLKTASLEDRVMAGLVDLALIVAAFALFVLVFVACTAHPPAGKPALLSAGLVLVGFCVLYHYLFFKFAEGTPGMRYAKIALCTFEDENPSRKAMCRRAFFLLLSAAPLGLGFAWAWFDPDRLGWHDRMSRIYQRSYS